MALNVPDEGENLILEMLVNKTAAQNLVYHLYKTNITPSDTDVNTTYSPNESTFTGYAAITLTGASWGTAAAGAIAYAQQTWTCSGVSAESVYGYYVTQLTSTKLMWAEKDASAPFAIAISGDAVKVTPAITAN